MNLDLVIAGAEINLGEHLGSRFVGVFCTSKI
jgi:hypothetical protein